MSAATFLAFDLGAESGRALAGRFDGSRVDLREIHRFPNDPVSLPDGLHWDVLRLFHEIKTGLKKAISEIEEIRSAGVDSWGVDFALVDQNGVLVSNPYHYRDSRTEGMVDLALKRVSREDIYRQTGIQFMRINTLYQLLSMEDSPLLTAADRLLLIPDLINYWLSGERACEFTNATTTQLYDSQNGNWAYGLMEKLGIPQHLFHEITVPGRELGPLLPAVANEVGCEATVTTVASHDTASAVVAVPAADDDFAYISSGTWSLVGVETPGPVTTEEALRHNFTNEGGFGGRTRFLKNVMGLWLLQECRRKWAQEGRGYSYEELENLAGKAPAFGSLIDPDHPVFLSPGDTPARIRSYCEATGQKPPQEPGEVARCIFESLALKYGMVVEQARNTTGKTARVIHVVGGGSQNGLLCQLTADASGVPVLAGPVEATALGNAMIQAFAQDGVGSLEEIREVVRRSVEVHPYEPSGSYDEWTEARERFSGIVDSAPPETSIEGG